MTLLVDVVVGQTSPLDFQLEATDPVTGAKTNPNLASASVTLVLKKMDGTAVDTTGDTTITDATQAKVRYTPDAGDLTAFAGQRLTGRFKVDVGGEISYFPSGQPDTWRVWAE